MRKGYLLVVTVVIAGAVLASTCVVAVKNSHREYASYEKLCSLGATGDDWVSFWELVTGRPPVVQLELPVSVPADIAFELLPDLHNLESLAIQYNSLTDVQLDTIQGMMLNAIHFEGRFPRDSDIDELSRFESVRFLYLPADQLSAESMSHLRSVLPSTRITLR